MAQLLKGVMKVNRKLNKKLKQCGMHISHPTHAHGTWKCRMAPVYASKWKNALLCPSKMAQFKRWVKYQNCRRREVFAESCACNPVDTSCLHEKWAQIRNIQSAVAKGRTEFTEDIKTCDECAPLKLHFMRWVHRQRVRRNRIHDSICRCPPSDLDCSRRRVARIKKIQQLIRLRRQQVLHLHGLCQLRNGGSATSYGHAPTFHVDTLPPHPDPWVRFAKGDKADGSHLDEAGLVSQQLGFRDLSSAASLTAVSLAAIALLAIVASLL